MKIVFTPQTPGRVVQPGFNTQLVNRVIEQAHAQQRPELVGRPLPADLGKRELVLVMMADGSLCEHGRHTEFDNYNF